MRAYDAILTILDGKANLSEYGWNRETRVDWERLLPYEQAIG